ncbi:MAG: hypothetical protein ACK583_15060 [Cyanobacteriota bacterium]
MAPTRRLRISRRAGRLAQWAVAQAIQRLSTRLNGRAPGARAAPA